MDRKWSLFAIFAKIEIRTVRVHALEPSAVNGLITTIARHVVRSALYETMNKMFGLRYLDE